MTPAQERKVFLLKTKARIYNREGKWLMLQSVIQQLEIIWDDDEAAKAFYTQLEREAQHET